MLVREGLDRCKKAGYDMVAVLGHRSYIPRFGFAQASDYGLRKQYGDAIDVNFMVLGLKDGILDEVSGAIVFAPEFEETGC